MSLKFTNEYAHGFLSESEIKALEPEVMKDRKSVGRERVCIQV